MNELTETEKAYLAGFIDGEGCIHICSSNNKRSPIPAYRLMVAISQADREYLERWRLKLGAGNVHKSGPGSIPGNKQVYNWQIYGREAEMLLRLVLPYLDIKREQAEVALKFRATVDKQGGGGRVTPSSIIRQREAYAQQLHALKRGGDPIEQAEEEAHIAAQQALWGDI